MKQTALNNELQDAACCSRITRSRLHYVWFVKSGRNRSSKVFAGVPSQQTTPYVVVAACPEDESYRSIDDTKVIHSLHQA